jgi:SH3-like domain-containing protein
MSPVVRTTSPAKVALTDSEKKLIENPASQPASTAVPKMASFQPTQVQRIILPSAKHSRGSKVIWSILISLLAVSIVLGAYLWYNNRSGDTASGLSGLFPNRVDSGTNSQNTPTTTGSQPAETPATPVVIATPTASSTPAPTPVANQVTISSTPTGYLNVRSTASSSGALVGKVYPGETYPYTQVKSGWYQIQLKDGTAGWVTGQYAKILIKD